MGMQPWRRTERSHGSRCIVARTRLSFNACDKLCNDVTSMVASRLGRNSLDLTLMSI